MRKIMNKINIGLLSKKRGNYKLQERLSGKENVIDLTNNEVEHHKHALLEAGFDVEVIGWDSNFIKKIRDSNIDLIFNVSSLIEASILEEYHIPFVGSGTDGITLARNKSLAKRLWMQARIPTSEFVVFKNLVDCQEFIKLPSITYPLFIKPIAGRGSAGITIDSYIENSRKLLKNVNTLLKTIGQPVIVEKYLKGREITIGLIGNGESLRTLPPLEIKYNGSKKFLTFYKKEMDNDKFICPAQLNKLGIKTLNKFVKKAFNVLGLRDYARIDTKLTPQGFMLLEANSFAGLMCTPEEKPHSYIGFMARAEGIGAKELFQEIIKIALERINN